MTIFLQTKIDTLRKQQQDLEKVFRPLFYRISNPKDRKDFTHLLDTPGLTIHDFILDQLKELMKISYPKLKLNTEEQEEKAKKHIGALPKEEYGVWVYYPWSNRLVHIVDEKEFIELRTSRNQYKITREERDLLAQKKIGIIGLSVGQSVSVTLAMERIGGELRLADFDVLELTNLNRIRTGIQNLGLPKVYTVAREIAEIDPFIKVTCFPKGLTEDSMEAFFTAEGKLDLLVEESDGFDIKILSRYKAKELNIPVIMEASDRCTVDVERFDLEPDRSILHGLVDHLDINTLKQLKTTEEKIPYMLDMVGLETSSARLKASMLEIDQTLTTWPQLASSVVMGGGITTDIARRVLLNSYTESGRYHIDIEELVGNKTKVNLPFPIETYDWPELTFDSIRNIVSSIKTHTNFSVPPADLKSIVETALCAPSAGNNQPWKWASKNNSLFLFHDKKYSFSWEDHDNMISNISLGAALESAILKAKELGYDAHYTLFPSQHHEYLVAHLILTPDPTVSDKVKHLTPYIGIRHTNRKKGDSSVLPINILEDIMNEAHAISRVQLNFATAKDALQELSEIVAEAERIRFLTPQSHHDFYKKELRWNTSNEIRRGLDIKTLEVTLPEKIGLIVASNPDVVDLLREWDKGAAFTKLSREAVASSSAVGLISISDDQPDQNIAGGQAAMRAWITATKHQLAFQPISAPLFLHHLIQKGQGGKITIQNQEKIKCLYQRLQHVFPELSPRKALFLFRLSKAESPATVSLKKEIQDMHLHIQE